ncbi:MAG: translation initiation factor IF-2 N-terminal domain-containing protein, partial [Muribaculaceae bacterium]|nr:translation initiation factor IF-2 N-terminal domain-containing protein [Muribaculaceae bacterium]
MTRTKISKVAKELNVALPTVVDFLQKQNISIDYNPNAYIEDDVIELLKKEYKKDQALKDKSDQFSSERQSKKVSVSAKPTPEPAEFKAPAGSIKGPVVVGKIELDKNGNPVTKKPDPKPQHKPESKPQAKPAPQPKPEPKPQPVRDI